MKFGAPEEEAVYGARGEGLEIIFGLPAGWSGTSLRWQQIECRAPGGGRSFPALAPSALLRGREAALCVGEDSKRAVQQLPSTTSLNSHNLALEVEVLPHFTDGRWGTARHWAKSTGEVIGRLRI